MRIGLNASGKPGEACFWKKQSPPLPCGQRTRLTAAGRRHAAGCRSATDEVIVDQVALGDALPGEDHPVGMGDADAVDLDRLAVRSRRRSIRRCLRRWSSLRRLRRLAFARFAALAFGIGRSLTISDAGLSLRSPLYVPCRTKPSPVQPRNAISATSSGLTKCACRRIVGGTSSAGGVFTLALLQLRPELVELALAEAAADPAAIAQPLALAQRRAGSRRTAGAFTSDGRQPMMMNSWPMPHLLLSQPFVRPER